MAAVDSLSRVLRLTSGRLPRVCNATRCEVVLLSGRPPPRLDAAGIHLRIVGRGSLTSTLPLGDVLVHEPGMPSAPTVVADGVKALIALPALSAIFRGYSWAVALRPGALHVWNISEVLARIARGQSRLQLQDSAFRVVAPIDDVLAARDSGRAAARRILLVGGEAAALVLAFAVLAAAGLRRDVDAERQRLEHHGASRGQSSLLAVAESCLAATLGTAVGLVVGIAATGLIASLDRPSRSRVGPPRTRLATGAGPRGRLRHRRGGSGRGSLARRRDRRLAARPRRRSRRSGNGKRARRRARTSTRAHDLRAAPERPRGGNPPARPTGTCRAGHWRAPRSCARAADPAGGTCRSARCTRPPTCPSCVGTGPGSHRGDGRVPCCQHRPRGVRRDLRRDALGGRQRSGSVPSAARFHGLARHEPDASPRRGSTRNVAGNRAWRDCAARVASAGGRLAPERVVRIARHDRHSRLRAARASCDRTCRPRRVARRCSGPAQSSSCRTPWRETPGPRNGALAGRHRQRCECGAHADYRHTSRRDRPDQPRARRRTLPWSPSQKRRGRPRDRPRLRPPRGQCEGGCPSGRRGCAGRRLAEGDDHARIPSRWWAECRRFARVRRPRRRAGARGVRPAAHELHAERVPLVPTFGRASRSTRGRSRCLQVPMWRVRQGPPA